MTPESMDSAPVNLVQRLLDALARDPGAPACLHDGKVLTRAGFLGMAGRFALALQRRGIKAGETVGVSLPHSPAHLAVLVALARLGAISLPVHPGSGWPARLRLLRHFGATTLVGLGPGAGAGARSAGTGPGLGAGAGAGAAPAAVRAGPGRSLRIPSDLKHIPFSVLLRAEEQADAVDLAGLSADWPHPEAPARIALTSGTTGFPNAVCYSQGYWVHRVETTIQHCDADTRLMPGNLHLTLGNISAFGALFAGGVVVFQRLHALDSFIQSIQLHHVTHALLVPATIKPLVAQLQHPGNAFPSLRYLRVVGGALSPDLAALAKRYLTPEVYSPYGISEVGAIAMATPELLESHPDCAGRPKPGVEVEVVDSTGRVLPVGETGELRVRVPGMPTGYYRNPVRTAEKFRDGWFHTSDIGCLTPDGLLRIEGRIDDRINLDGTKFYPEQVEQVLTAHPEVRDAAVFVDFERSGGKSLVAALILEHDGPLPADLSLFCQERRLGNKMPQAFHRVEALPRNPSGKLLRASLPDLMKQQPFHTVH